MVVWIFVLEGGHHIPEDVIARRYQNGLKNLFEIYSEIVDELAIFNNSNGKPTLIAKKKISRNFEIFELKTFNQLNLIYHEKR